MGARPTDTGGATALILALALLVCLSLLLLPAPGTYDVDVFLRWGDELYRSGFRTGYAAIVGRWEATFLGHNWDMHGGEYPPLGCILLEAIAAIADWLGIAHLLVFKAALLVFTLLAAGAIQAATRSLAATLAFYAVTLLATSGLGYTDMMTAPFAIAALAATRADHPVRAVLWFAGAVLVKWQALLVAPFLAIHLLRIDGFADLARLPRERMTWRLLAVVGMVAAVATALAGTATWVAFYNATRHPFLSGTALNLPWLLSYILLLLRDPAFHAGDQMHILMLSASELRPVRLLFGVVMLATVYSHMRSPKTYANMLFFMVLGVLTYGVWNTAVHENHWFVAVAPAVLLAHETGLPRHKSLLVLVAAMLNINLFVFYGIVGSQLAARAVGFDLTLVLAGLFAVAWLTVFRDGWRLGSPSSPRPMSVANSSGR
jgi:hypothetical protein